MKAFKRVLAGAVALSSALSIAACGNSSSSDSSSMPEKELKEDQQQIVQRLADSITEPRKLDNTTIKWFSHWDINPTESEDKDIGVDLALFKTKYDGKIEWMQTTWDNYFDDLAKNVMANSSPDFIGADDMNVFPKCAIKEMIEPIEGYIDFSTELWAPMKTAADKFIFDGKHYVGVVRVDPSYIWIYNKKVIDEIGMDDPAELYKQGKWNWDTMCEMCIDFTNAEEDKYALDGWYYENALLESTGMPLIDMKDGEIVNNLKAPELAKAEDMMYNLQKNEVVYPKDQHDWKVRGDVFGTGLASGLTLFYPIGFWGIENAPSSTEPYGNIADGEVMFVPVPCAADSDKQYIPSRIHAFCLAKGCSNPEGVAAWLDCTRYAEIDEAAHQITLDQLAEDYGWTQEMLDMRDEIYKMAAEAPVFEFAQGVSQDISNLTDNIIKGTMNPAATNTWTELVEENQNALEYYIKKEQDSIKK